VRMPGPISVRVVSVEPSAEPGQVTFTCAVRLRRWHPWVWWVLAKPFAGPVLTAIYDALGAIGEAALGLVSELRSLSVLAEDIPVRHQSPDPVIRHAEDRVRRDVTIRLKEQI
jgi:hypothetical protein